LCGRGGEVLTLCAISAWIRIIQCWVELKLDSTHPLVVFTDTGLADGNIKFIRPSHINAALYDAAKEVYNVTDKKSLALFSSHPIQVGTRIALHATGIQQQEIKFTLHWESDSF
jgi:hypothetical protein